MSNFPIELDRMRNFKFGMKAIDLIEKKYKKPVMQIEGISDGSLTMKDYAFIIYAGLVHEDKNLTPDKVMDLVDEHSSLGKVTVEMWKAFNDVFKLDVDEETEETEEAEETEGKNE